MTSALAAGEIISPDWLFVCQTAGLLMSADDVRISPAIREIHTRFGAGAGAGPGPDPCPGPGPDPGWRIRGPSWCVLQAPASAILQGGEQTAGTQPG